MTTTHLEARRTGAQGVGEPVRLDPAALVEPLQPLRPVPAVVRRGTVGGYDWRQR